MNDPKQYQRFMTRMRGFSHGAGSQAMSPDLIDDEDYSRGYIDGQQARKTYSGHKAADYMVTLHEIKALTHS